MSGGYFDYQQYMIGSIADQIKQVIINNDSQDINQWGDRVGRGYEPETIDDFEEGLRLLRLAQVYATRIDYLLSGDDGEESFRRRLAEDLADLESEL